MIFTVLAIPAVSVVVLANQGLRAPTRGVVAPIEISSSPKNSERYVPTSEQWQMLTVEPVSARVFRSGQTTEGRIAINEELSTPVFSPYAGRVTRLVAKPGDVVSAGQPLFFIEANDMVQAQNDFLSAVAVVNKARSRVTLTGLVEKQNRTLFESRAGSLRDFQTAQAEAVQADSELQGAESAVEAARNRLVILGKTDEEIKLFREKGRISPETPIYAPIGGTVVQRRLGPGQYVSYTSTGSVDPVFVIGDLSSVWLVAYVREAEAPKVRVGQNLEFTVLAYPDQVFQAKVVYVSTSLDPISRRLMVRATVQNDKGLFKTEMFASVVLYSDDQGPTMAVPRDALVYDAERPRVWVALDDKSIEMRNVRVGRASGGLIQVLDGLKPGERVVTRGSLFIARAAGT